MAILKAVKLTEGKRKRANLAGILKYVLKDEKTEERLTYGQCIDVPEAYDKMIETKKLWNKESGREYFHLILSYPPNENITPAQALEQTKKFLDSPKFWGFEIVVATHKDRKHIHSHIIINSVSFVSGKKFHLSKDDLNQLKNLQNEINIKDGYSPAPAKYIGQNKTKRIETVANNKNTYQVLHRAEQGEIDSYVTNCALALLQTKKKAKTKEEFILMMKAKGFATEWSNKKHITFTDIKRAEQGEQKCKIRLKRIADYFSEFQNVSTKEELLNELERNGRQTIENAGIIRESRRQLSNAEVTIASERTKLSNRRIEQNNRRTKPTNNRAGQQYRKTTENYNKYKAGQGRSR